jgi:hypothetical protein
MQYLPPTIIHDTDSADSEEYTIGYQENTHERPKEETLLSPLLTVLMHLPYCFESSVGLTLYTAVAAANAT